MISPTHGDRDGSGDAIMNNASNLDSKCASNGTCVIPINESLHDHCRSNELKHKTTRQHLKQSCHEESAQDEDDDDADESRVGMDLAVDDIDDTPVTGNNTSGDNLKQAWHRSSASFRSSHSHQTTTTRSPSPLYTVRDLRRIFGLPLKPVEFVEVDIDCDKKKDLDLGMEVFDENDDGDDDGKDDIGSRTILRCHSSSSRTSRTRSRTHSFGSISTTTQYQHTQSQSKGKSASRRHSYPPMENYDDIIINDNGSD